MPQWHSFASTGGKKTEQLKGWLVINLWSLSIHSISLCIHKQRELLFILLSFNVGIPNLLMYFNLRKSHSPHSTPYLYTTAFSDPSSSIIFWVSALSHLKSLGLTTSQKISKLLSKTSSEQGLNKDFQTPNSFLNLSNFLHLLVSAYNILPCFDCWTKLLFIIPDLVLWWLFPAYFSKLILLCVQTITTIIII